MAQLLRRSKQQVLIPQLNVAQSFWPRMKGLLGHHQLNQQEGMWIHNCNSIHTFFMKFSIDCIFLDQKMKVHSVKKNIPPFQIVWPQWGARSVVELGSGSVDRLGIQVGEQLDVGD